VRSGCRRDVTTHSAILSHATPFALPLFARGHRRGAPQRRAAGPWPAHTISLTSNH
jgi:hypothetical protein